MKKINHLKVSGTATGDDKNIELDEITILADPQVIMELGRFFIDSAQEMLAQGTEHLHLQDWREGFLEGVDFVIVNGRLVGVAR